MRRWPGRSANAVPGCGTELGRLSDRFGVPDRAHEVERGDGHALPEVEAVGAATLCAGVEIEDAATVLARHRHEVGEQRRSVTEGAHPIGGAEVVDVELAD